MFVEINGLNANICFSAAHILPGHKTCGVLHGHTYFIHIRIHGTPNKDGIIMDFSDLKKQLRTIASHLDHKILLPEKNNAIQRNEKTTTITSKNNTYQLPTNNCIFLPINATTAEQLATYILHELQTKMTFPKNITSLELGVDEGYGQGAWITKNLG